MSISSKLHRLPPLVNETISTHVELRLPTDFRMIPLGDIDLRICRDGKSGVVGRRGGQSRMYSARLHGAESDRTVVLYQGENAEEVRCQFPLHRSPLRRNFTGLAALYLASFDDPVSFGSFLRL